MKVSPFFKVRYWEDKHHSKLFVFVGDSVATNVNQVLQKIESSQSVTSLSKAELQLLSTTFGSSFEHSLGLSIINTSPGMIKLCFVNGTINLDDNINWLKQKMFYHLHKKLRLSSHEETYMWIHRKFDITPLIIQTFITHCFKSEKRISVEYFVHNVERFFGVQLPKIHAQFIDKIQAIKYIEELKTAKRIEPILFKYMSEDYDEYVNYDPIHELSVSSMFDSVDKLTVASFSPNLVESFDLSNIVDECVNMIDIHRYQKIAPAQTLVSKYFPFAHSRRSQDYIATTLKFVEDIENAEKVVRNHTIVGGHRLDTFTNFLHLRVNELNYNRRQDLQSLFEHLSTSQEVPFIKYNAVSNNYYKVHKESMYKLRNELIGKWTEVKTQPYPYVLLRVHYTKDVFCSVQIFETMCYDVKFTFGNMMKETSAKIISFFSRIDAIIGKVKDVYPSLYIPLINRDFMNVSLGTSTTKVLRWLTTNSIKSDKHTLNYGNFVKVVKNRMFSYFNVINNPNKNLLHLQYKKIDNYLKYENIQVFITFHYVNNRDEMIKKIQGEFNLSPEEAEREFEKWTSQNELELLKLGDRTFSKPKNDNYVNIKIRLTSSIDLNFNIEGAKSDVMHTRILNLLLVLMDMSHERILDRKSVPDAKIDTILYGKASASPINNKYAKTDVLKRSSSKAKGNSGTDLDFELEALEDYEGFGDLFEDDEDLKALEMEFLKELQNEEKLLVASGEQTKKQTDEDDDKNVKAGDEDSIMKSYFMNMLKSADKELIDYKVAKGQKVLKRYSTVCQWNDRRQPIVVNKTEMDKVKEFQKDIRYVKTGSSEEMQKKNYYICPQVWCPKSKVALTYKDFKGKYNESCPYPDVEEKPILLTNHYWGKGEAGLTREHFPGFLDPKTHPGRLCLPCCFKKEAKEGSRNKQNENTCKNQWSDTAPQEEETEVFGNEKYILGEIFVPLEPFRYGLLPKDVSDLFGNKTCGNGLDGKGLMSDKTDCMLRRGVSQKTQSFLNALISLLDNPKIFSLQSLIDSFSANISVEQFVGLENGKVMKMFINKEYSIFNSENFKDFTAWFLHAKQKHYIAMFKMEQIAQELLTISNSAGGFAASDTNKKAQRTIIREFLIFNAYKHFLMYMSDMSVDKHHNLLIDYVQSENRWLNINNYNVIIIEHEPAEGKTHMICPFNRNAAKVFDMTDPFVMIFKQNNYYEPLCHVKVKNGSIDARTKFHMNTAPSGIRKIIQYYMKNCSVETPINTASDLEIFIETTTGHSIKRYVIDYSFQVCGFLVSSVNLFVPLKDKVDIYDLKQTEFVYYDDVPRYKCTYQEDTIHAVYNKIYKQTGDEFYKPTEYYYDRVQQDRLIGFKLNHSYFVPTNYNEKTDAQYVSEMYDDDLSVFVEYEKDNARVQRVSRDQQMANYFRQFSKLMMDYIATHKELNDEFVFLKDGDNPFPKAYKRKKLFELVKKAMKSNDFQVFINANVNTQMFTSHFVEDILLSTGSTHSIMLRQMFGVKQKFKKESYELLFDQKDVLDGRIQEKLKYIQNPYASLMERVDKYMRDYMFEYVEKEDMEYFKRYVNPSTIYEDVPYKFRKLMAGFQLVTYNTTLSPYTPDTLFDMFLSVCKAKQVTHVTNVDTLKLLMKQKMFQAYRHDELDLLYSNESYKYNAKLLKLKSQTIDNNLQIMDSMSYYPSYFELLFLVMIARVRVIVVGRKTKTNDSGIEIIPGEDKYNRYSRYVIINQYYDRFNNRDVFQFAVKGPNTKNARTILRKPDLPSALQKYI